MFKVKAKMDGREIEIKWDNGSLTGDPLAVETVISEAEMALEVGPPTGPFTGEDHLKNELSASILIVKTMDYNTAELIEGAWPQIPTKLPDGVVG